MHSQCGQQKSLSNNYFTVWWCLIKCMHLVMRGHFPSRDKDGTHTTASAIPENPMLQANLMALSFIELKLPWVIKVYIGGMGIFDVFAAVTLTQWPSYTKFTYIPGKYTGRANVNFLCQGFWQLSSDRHTYIQTNTIDRNYKPHRFASGQSITLVMWASIHEAIQKLCETGGDITIISLNPFIHILPRY